MNFWSKGRLAVHDSVNVEVLVSSSSSSSSFALSESKQPKMVPVSVFLLLLLSFVVVVCAQSNGTRISTGSSLVAGSSSVQAWRSPSDDFAFGFRNVDNNNDDLFLLAIWFYKVPENNIVWFAKEKDNNPVFAPRGSKVELTATSGLVLRNGNGGEIWKSEPITASVAFGSMKDTGNFVLVDSINGSIWESFSYPTDTLLPTQKLEVDGVLSSRKSQGNFSLGKFQFRLLRDGNAVLNTINLRSGFPYDAYYISNTHDSASSQNSGRQVIFDEQGFLYVLKRNGEQSNITQPSVGNPVEAYYYKTTMNFDGVLSVSSYPKGIDGDANGSWKDLFRIPDNICLSNENPIERLGSGICGFNSICTLKSNGRPSCNCAQGYSLVDPNDELGNCKPYITQSCDEELEVAENFNQNLYEMVDLPNTNWPMYDYERFSTLNEQVCKSSCLEDCFCVLAVFGGSDCWKKRLPLSNGRQDAKKNVSLESFPDADRTVKKQRTLIIVMSALFGSSVFIIFILLGFKCLGLFVLKKEKLAETCTKNVFSECNLIQFTFMDIYKATNGFKEEIGRGSCGIIICCRRNVETELGDGEREEGMILTDWAYDCYEKGRVEALIEGDMEAMDDLHRVESIINTGSFLIAGDVSTSPWLSPSKDFAFGFRELENGLFLLCIWYNKLPEKTVVWFARHDQNPALRGSKVELTALDGLLLRNSRGGTSKLIGLVSGTVASAVMNDTGNLMLKDSDSMLLWESFKHPTDTLLPTQKMEINDILSSYKSHQNYSLGKFRFQLWKGSAVLNIRNLPTGNMYVSYDTIRATNGYEIIFDKDGVLYIMQRDGNRVNISEPEGDYPADIHYYKVTLNFDGVLTVSHYPKNPTTSSNAAWRDFKKMPDNICMAMRGELSSGICGYNSICTLNDDQRPRCKCPTGYSFMDLNDTYSNCVANIPQICEEGARNSTDDLYSLQELPNTDWPMLDYERYNPFNAEECKKACLLDCLCVVAVYRDNTCWKKKLPLSNGREDSKEISVSFLKLRRNTSSTGKPQDGFPIPEGKKNQQTLIVVISVLLGCSLFVILILASMICWGFISCNKKKLAAGDIQPSESFESNNLCQFTYKELREATNGFKEELGRGSCGIVYKGRIKTGVVAVKQLDRVFGVQLLEIICCKRNGDMNDFEGGQELLVDWAYDCFQQGRLDVLVEEDLEAMDDMRRLETFVMVAIWCLQEDPSQRPTMKRVTWMLEGIAPVSVPPNPNPFTSNC
ncbi:G-type lectin S-receptor-like serine/threonine-protein kinase RLK1, partial [Cucurbita argyrosperma subsp. argyrosperma]